jgi:hypothetical protein
MKSVAYPTMFARLFIVVDRDGDGVEEFALATDNT